MVVCAALLLASAYMKSRTLQDIPERAAFSVLSSGRISVKISGNVRHPGVYDVPANSMASSVINMAVPLRQLEQSGASSLALQPLRNGATVTVTAKPDGSNQVTVGGMTVPERLVLGIPLEIVAMTEADFDRLPGIGPALARRIVTFRQNNGGLLRVVDLQNVEGIGEKKYKMLQRYFQHTETIK
jgi:competence protein ComEA